MFAELTEADRIEPDVKATVVRAVDGMITWVGGCRLHFPLDGSGRVAWPSVGGPRRTPAQRPTRARRRPAARHRTKNHLSFRNLPS